MNSTRLFLRKKKTLDTSTRSVFQLFEAILTFEDGEGVLSANLQKKKEKKNESKKKQKKKHSDDVMMKKVFILSLEHTIFLIQRAGWIITKIHSHLHSHPLTPTISLNQYAMKLKKYYI